MANTLRFKRGLASGIPTALAGEPLFTTDTFDLYIGNGTTNTRFQKYIASGATTQILRGDGSLYTFPLAISSPTNGQVLKYNGTSWVNSTDTDTGITTLNTLTALTQTFATGTSGTDFNISSASSTHTFNIPTASATNRGLLSSADWTTFNNKQNALTNPITGSLTTNYLPKATGATTLGNSNLINDASGSLLLGITSVTYGATGKFINRTGGTSDVGLALNGGAWSIASIGGEPAFYLSSNIVAATGVGGSTETARGGMGFEYSNSSAPTDLVLGIFGTPTVTSSVRFFNSSERMRLTTLGNLHIGTFSSDSGEKLQVTGTMKVTGASSFGSSITGKTLSLDEVSGSGSGRISLLSGGTRFGYIGTSLWALGEAGTDLTIVSVGGLRFATNDSSPTKMMLTTSGNLGLGVTPSAWGTTGLGTNTRAIEISQLGSSIAAGAGAFILTNNAYVTNAAYIYARSSLPATQYAMNTSSGQHQWFNAPSGTAGNAITFTQAMTLDASGRLGIGSTTPGTTGLDTGVTQLFVVAPNSNTGAAATFVADSLGRGILVSNQAKSAVVSVNVSTTGNIGTNTAHDLTFLTGATEGMRLTNSTRNLHIGTFSADSGEKLQVNGTAKITGYTAIGGNLGGANQRVANFRNSGGNGYIEIQGSGTVAGQIISDANGALYLVTNATAGTAGTTRLFVGSTGDIGIGTLSPSAKLDVQGNALVTGNLTVDTNTLFVDATNKRVGISATPLYKLHVRPVANANFGVRNAADFNASFTGTAIGSFNDANNANTNLYLESSQLGLNLQSAQNVLVGGNLGIAMTPSYKIDVTGSARVSDAIAIGTTPDTNNPFKILKNLNTTVGIKFENTNTSSLAFSAVQLGTDISGGTKFTNLVYASSGVTASGVYNPDGTSLINNGNGGLNFLGNPIRMYTGGSNGVLRWDISNEGIIQYNATSPTTSATDAYKQYSADVTAGNAAPHFRTENGAVIKLYQETTAVGNAIVGAGGGSAMLDDDTFDGYTLRQVVRALRNQGILQ